MLLVGTLDKDVFLGDIPVIRAAIETAGTSELVHWTGFVQDAELSALNTGAVALLLPSAAEGFGLPAVEAAACGTPVIATTESPLPHLLAGGGVFVKPGNEPALADAMSTLWLSQVVRDEMGHRALMQANKLTWDRSARSALESIRNAAGKRSTAIAHVSAGGAPA